MSGEIVPPLPCKIDNRVSKAQKTRSTDPEFGRQRHL
jgi:hypothetical protein